MGLKAASGGDPQATHYVVSVDEYWLRLAVTLGEVRVVGPDAVYCVPVWLVYDVSRSRRMECWLWVVLVVVEMVLR